MSPHLLIVKDLVLEAGQLLLSYLNKNKNIRNKGVLDLVTDADEASEKLLFSKLCEYFPEYGILAEEGSLKESENGYIWVVDPLDGTTSFAHGFPFFSVSVGLVDMHKDPVAGFVYNPLLKELFFAQKGEGAFLNNQAISVSETSVLEKALLATGFPYNRREILDEILERLARVLNAVQDIRRTGSASLDICYVACGRIDGYYESGLKPWDTCAAACILKEAGGKLSRFSGEPFNIFFPEIVASNGKIHADVLRLLQLSSS
ncbi:MAG: inositol monophosphatase [Leptospiraceae bacterium]|nr:inositol monophosphatase [Leptospiraceae bacterium]MDW8305696.1 inositol monophosphatase family protein [Leptospiraceae bacterium]